MNRKLIRTTLAEVKERAERGELAPPPQQHQQHGRREGGGREGGRDREERGSNNQRRRVPPEQTNAESFYYKKQMDSKTPMVLVLQDGEQLHGTIEWYDKGAIKLHRDGVPNLLVLKHNIKYIYKENDEDEE
ncbi:MAG TPA: RNA chaperone Hfq [Blastocatellia bacterium]|nr:RNA chaperone Hfq [Blastocatellia bacterium]